MKSDWLSRLTPPGISLRAHGHIFVIGNLIALLFSSSFIGNYSSAYNGLFRLRAGKKELLPNALMPHFEELIGKTPLFYLLLAILLVSLAIVHFLYFYRGSKSIYVMRRLPTRGALTKQIFALPCLMAGVTLLFALLVYGIYFVVYLAVTPNECLPVLFL